jgi:hypothetical protein
MCAVMQAGVQCRHQGEEQQLRGKQQAQKQKEKQQLG